MGFVRWPVRPYSSFTHGETALWLPNLTSNGGHYHTYIVTHGKWRILKPVHQNKLSEVMLNILMISQWYAPSLKKDNDQDWFLIWAMSHHVIIFQYNIITFQVWTKLDTSLWQFRFEFDTPKRFVTNISTESLSNYLPPCMPEHLLIWRSSSN